MLGMPASLLQAFKRRLPQLEARFPHWFSSEAWVDLPL